MNYEELPAFAGDLKKLLKRFRTLEEDLARWRANVLEIRRPEEWKNYGIVAIENHCETSFSSHKVRKFSCRSLKGKGVKSGLRIIFVHEAESQRITFIEIYYKGDLENENVGRLSNFCRGIGHTFP
jgi:hypothetical protein